MEFIDISKQDLNELNGRIESAITDGQTVGPGDLSLLLQMAKTYAYIHEMLSSADLTVYRLKKLLGIVPKSEKKKRSKDDKNIENTAENLENTDANVDNLDDKAIQQIEELIDNKILEVLENPNPAESAPAASNSKNPKRKEHGKKNANAFKEAETVIHPITDMQRGCVCPDCSHGKLYKFEPSSFVRIAGSVPLQATIHVAEQVRCNFCQKVYKANLPAELLDDGAAGQRYGYSAVSMVALLKYAAAFPWYRLSDLQVMLGTPVTPSSLWDMMEGLGNAAQPIYQFLKKLAAIAPLYYLDDTTNRITNSDPIMKKKRGTNTEKLRTGIHTSGLIAVLEDGRQIILFKTGIQHAGEHFDQILEMRPDNAGTFTYMSDALTSNNPTVRTGEQSLCNAHARRAFVELEDKSPDECKRVIAIYAKIYKLDSECKAEKLSKEARLLKHQDMSLPLMLDLFSWSQSLLEDKKVEPNSSLGKAFTYLLKHKNELMAFTRIAGAPIDNNIMERALRLIVLNRKNSLNFKEHIGAQISDVITSLCSTAEAAGINCYDYLNCIQRYADFVKKSPDKFLPWNYRQAVNDLIEKSKEIGSC